MNILSLDLGTHCGWALREGGRLESGVQDFSLRRGESRGMLFIRFNAWLSRMFEIGGPSLGIVVYEAPHHRGGNATEVAVGLSTRVMEMCAKCQVEHASVHSMTLKKWATGSGKASKEEMIAYYHAIYGDPKRKVTDDNECDALWLLQYAIKEILGEKTWSVPPAAAGSIEPSASKTPAP